MTHKRANQVVTTLIDQGFDRTSAYDQDEDDPTVDQADRVFVVAPKCSQCEVLVINGTAYHEHGCPNQVYKCKGCNARVDRRGAYCEDCQ